MKSYVLAACILANSVSVRAVTEVGESRRYADEATGLIIVGGEVELPFPGHWILPDRASSSALLTEGVLIPPPEVVQALQGRRHTQLEEQREIQRSAYLMHRLYSACLEYARGHDGRAPETIGELENVEDLKAPDGVGIRVHYLPGVLILTDPADTGSLPSDPVLLAFETRPVIDDGRHWVLLSNGRTERREVDPDLFARHDASLVPGRKPQSAIAGPDPEYATYQVVARLVDPSAEATTLVASNRISGATQELTWDLAHSAAGGPDLVQTFATHRLHALLAVSGHADTPVIQHWLSVASRLYQVDGRSLAEASDPRANRRRGRRGDRQASLFGVLGGRAAIRETLQLQDLTPSENGGPDAGSVAIDGVPGVQVKSHPFEEMLAGAAGGRLELARVAPPDRLFAYFAQPKGMLSLLDGGTEFLFNAGSLATGRSVAYRLQDRYFARLGLSEAWARAFLTGGAVEELALIAPDLFFIDGADLTVVARLKNPLLATAALAVVGMGSLSDRTVVRNADGEPVSWAKRGDLLFISTQEAELDGVLALHAAGGAGSLGASAEFCYMLTQLPVEESTTTLVYFSDPFIRRLVGPQAKIGQLRRLQARAELEALSAAALLYRADGHAGPPDLAELLRRGYALPPVRAVDARLGPDGAAVSDRFGTPARMHSLSALPVTEVAPAEARAYSAYRDNYTRYWRRFFDPIAIRINQPAARTYQLDTFILPLVDNSLYQGLRRMLNPMESGLPLVVPRLDPAPAALLSFNVSEGAWIDSLDDLSEVFTRMFGLQGRILDYLGPDVHIAVMDDDPIVSFGSGELAGMLGGIVGSSEEMVIIPLLGSVLTRPTHILIGLSDPDAVLRFLRSSPLPSAHALNDDWLEAAMYRQTGQDRWIYRLSLAGVVHLRFGIEVQDRYLVISNLPLTTETVVTPGAPAQHSGAQLLLQPAVCQQQLASLFASAQEQQRAAALEGIGFLLPFLWAGAPTVEAARADHARLFGFTPVHPAPGNWSWDGARITSTVYGDAIRPEQPAHPAGDRGFGMLGKIDELRLSMQLEQDGLRATALWSLRENPGR